VSNTALGKSALFNNTTASYNTAVGHSALFASTTASYNNAFGYGCLDSNITGAANVAMGYNALTANTTGANNTAIGHEAGNNITSGSNNLCIGHKAGQGQITTGNYELYIARAASGGAVSSVWIYGNSFGACYQGNNTSSWSTVSDERIKKDIADSPDGLAKIDALQVRNFNYRTQEEITAEGLHSCDSSGLQTGVIAQELESVLPKAVTASTKGMKQVNTDPIFWAMVKAIQELSTENDALKARLTAGGL
jgi:hypothetical protein